MSPSSSAHASSGWPSWHPSIIPRRWPVWTVNDRGSWLRRRSGRQLGYRYTCSIQLRKASRMVVEGLVLAFFSTSLCSRLRSAHAIPTVLLRGRRRSCHVVAVIRADGTLSTRPIDDIEDRPLATVEGRGGRLRPGSRLRVRMRRRLDPVARIWIAVSAENPTFFFSPFFSWGGGGFAPGTHCARRKARS